MHTKFPPVFGDNQMIEIKLSPPQATARTFSIRVTSQMTKPTSLLAYQLVQANNKIQTLKFPNASHVWMLPPDKI